MKITKTSTRFAGEESIQIIAGTKIVYQSPTYEVDKTKSYDVCLPATTEDQYTLVLKDRLSDSWNDGSFIQFEGEYGNIVLKTFMTEMKEERVPLSLYTPVKKTDTWKMASEFAEQWNAYSYQDAAWTDYASASPLTLSSTLYFRKTFVGLENMAAAELRVNYKFGVVAYINGAEVFRDNMPAGEVTPATLATGAYETMEYRGLVRSANKAQSAQSVLAIELHPLQAGAETTFGAFLALYASSFPDSKCYIVPAVPTLTASAGLNAPKAMDFNKGGTSFTAYEKPVSLLYDYSAAGLYAVNGARVFPSSAVSSSPTGFEIAGSDSASQGFTPVFVAAGWKYFFKTPTYGAAMSDPEAYKYYRVTVTTTASLDVRIYEMNLLVCNRAPPTSIKYPMATYSFLALYESVAIEPVSSEFSNCTVTPALPAGLHLTATCGIAGIAQAASSATYVITTPQYGGISGTLTLTITECTGTMLRLLRTYASYSTYEKFSVKDHASGETLMVVDYATSQQDKTEVAYPLCVSVPRISVVVESTEKFWKKGSFLRVQAYISITDFDTIAFLRYDSNLALPTTVPVQVAAAVKPGAAWHYKMGAVPAQWWNDSTSGWEEAAPGQFPASSTTVQLYKKQFTASSLEGLAGFTFAVKYKAGCIVMLNGHEVFRKGVDGELTASTTPSGSYNTLAFRRVTVPLVSNGVAFLREGANTIAVAVVTMPSEQGAATFDCFARFTTPETSRVYEYTMTQYGISGTNGEPFGRFFSQYISGLTSNNWIQLELDNDRREWINAMDVQAYYLKLDNPAREFTFQAKNPEDSAWTDLAVVGNMTWSSPGQHRKLWIQATKPYSIFRWTNFGRGNAEKTNWNLQALDLLVEAVPATIPALTYESVAIYRDIEMAEVYPSSSLYYGFACAALPRDIVIDPYTGVISGTPRALQPATVYTVTATSVNGQPAEATVSIAVEKCYGGKGLMTIAWRTDAFGNENSYALYRGRGTAGEAVRQSTFVPVSSGMFYVDVCYEHGLYTFQGVDSVGDGWSPATGYRLTVDQGEFPVDMRELPRMPKPASVTTVFSTYFPFQVEFEEWSVLAEGAPVAGWTTADFAESWPVLFPSAIGTAQQTTVYLRKAFAIPSLDDYYVLNVRAKFAGGCVAYFNGRLVARFFLPATFDAATEGEPHESGFYKFHVILAVNGATEASNVLAFELHRAAGVSSAEPVVFDATGVFGVEECSPLADTVLDFETEATEGAVGNLFDFQAFTSLSFENVVDAYVQWSVANRVGSVFNEYGYYPQSAPQWGYSLFGKFADDEEWNNISESLAVTDVSRTFASHAVEVGMVGYHTYKFVVESEPAEAALIDAFLFRYCKATGTVCPGIDEYPAVAEGQLSPAVCPYGFTGYLYRLCQDGQLSDVHSERCLYKLPQNLTYGVESVTLVKDVEMEPLTPSFVNLIQYFNVSEVVDSLLPAGLTLDPMTGVISGIPTTLVEAMPVEIVGENAAGIVSTRFLLTVRKGSCAAEGKWPATPVDLEAVYECQAGGSFVGTQKRQCLLGKKDGEWQPETGMCVSVVLIVVVVVIVVIVIVVVVILIIRHAASRAVVSNTGRSAGTKKAKQVPAAAKTKAVKV